MAITVQGRQADGSWGVRNAFTTENKKVLAGTMTKEELTAQARAMRDRWLSTYPEGGEVRVHDDSDDPKPASRPLPSTRAEAHARHVGWLTTQEMHGDGPESYGVVHPDGRWAPDFGAAMLMPRLGGVR